MRYPVKVLLFLLIYGAGWITYFIWGAIYFIWNMNLNGMHTFKRHMRFRDTSWNMYKSAWHSIYEIDANYSDD
jgi:hypothetical protein